MLLNFPSPSIVRTYADNDTLFLISFTPFVELSSIYAFGQFCTKFTNLLHVAKAITAVMGLQHAIYIKSYFFNDFCNFLKAMGR